MLRYHAEAIIHSIVQSCSPSAVLGVRFCTFGTIDEEYIHDMGVIFVPTIVLVLPAGAVAESAPWYLSSLIYPPHVARISGVIPVLSLASISAPLRSRRTIAFSALLAAAVCSGVQPQQSRASWLAFISSKACTNPLSLSFWDTARWRALVRLYFLLLQYQLRFLSVDGRLLGGTGCGPTERRVTRFVHSRSVPRASLVGCNARYVL